MKNDKLLRVQLCFLVILLLVCLSRPSFAQWTGATLIETGNVGGANGPQIAMNASGDAIAVWYQGDGTHYSIFANHYTAGSGWGTATLIETNNTDDAISPEIAINTNGDAMAVWYQRNGTRYSIWANRYTAGSGWGTAAQIGIDNIGYTSGQQIAMNANGDAIAVWYQYDGVRYNVWTNRFTVGSGWEAATLIETDNAGGAMYPEIAMDVNGNAIAVWMQNDGTRYNVWAKHYTAGSGWGVATLIETDNAGHAADPRIAMNANGNAIVVWYQSDGTRHNVWAKHYTAGSGWGGGTLIETNNTGHASGQQIVMNAKGDAMVVWSELDGSLCGVAPAQYYCYSAWANRYTAGSGWGAATRIETNNASDVGGQQIAMDANGNAIAVWYQGDGARNNIWANRYTAGSGWGTAILIETDNAGGANNPKIAMDASGNAIAAWSQYDGVRTNIWTNRFTMTSSSPLPLSALNDGTQVQVPSYVKYIRDFKNGLWPKSIYFEKPSPSNPNCVIDHSRGHLGSGRWFPFDPVSDNLGRFGYKTTLTPLLGCALPDCVFTDFMLITRQEIICPLPLGSIIPSERFAITVLPGEVKVINGETWALAPLEPSQFPTTSWVTVVPPGKRLGLPSAGGPYIQTNTFDEVVALGGGDPPATGFRLAPRATWELSSSDGRTKIYVTGLATSGSTGQDLDDYHTTTAGLMGQPIAPNGFDPTVDAITDFIGNQRGLHPTRGIDLIGHSLGCLEATLIYAIWTLKTGDRVFCLSPPREIPVNRMLPNASGALYIAYGGINDPINGRAALNQQRRAAGVNIIDVDTGLGIGSGTPGVSGFDTHDRCRYEVKVFGSCIF